MDQTGTSIPEKVCFELYGPVDGCTGYLHTR